MSSRNIILEKIKQKKPAAIALDADEPITASLSSACLTDLVEVLDVIKTQVVIVDGIDSIKFAIKQLQEQGCYVISTVEELNDTDRQQLTSLNATQLGLLDYAFIKGNLAVTENGAIWVTDKSMVNRLLPFICKYLVLVIEEQNIVANMHEAYEQIDIINNGYGVFIAGPSKTADIEQSLVIGAHGPLSLKVYIIRKA